jgi:alpha-1,6-mannosyltransferase
VRVAAFAALLPAGFIFTAIAQRWLLRAPPSAIRIDLAQPLPVATNWNAFGLAICASLLFGLAIAGVGYVLLVRSALSGALVSPVPLELVCALALVAAACVPIFLSSDVYAYAAYGAMAAAGIDPYSHVLLPAHDPLFAAATVQWGNPIPACVYGPLFVEISHALVIAFAPAGINAQLNAFRVLAAIALVACIPLMRAAFAGFAPTQRIAAAAIVGLNPVVIWSAAEGHNDALMLAIALSGFAILRRFPTVGAGIVSLSGLIKAPGLFAAFAPMLSMRKQAVQIGCGAAIGAFAVALAFAPFAPGIRSALGSHRGSSATVSLFSLNPYACIALALVIAYFGLRRIRRDQLDGWCMLAVAIWVLIPNPYPWYGLWFLPVAALAPQSRGAVAIVLLSFTTTLRYLPDAIGPLSPTVNLLLSLVAFSPLLLLLPIRRPSTTQI